MQPGLTANVTRTELLRLDKERQLVLADLDVSYMQLLHLDRLLAPSQVKLRKRRKKRIAPANRVMKIWLRQSSGERIVIPGSIAMTAPLDGPATVSLEVANPELISVGSMLEFEVCEA